jgi:hypothetical protein
MFLHGRTSIHPSRASLCRQVSVATLPRRSGWEATADRRCSVSDPGRDSIRGREGDERGN